MLAAAVALVALPVLSAPTVNFLARAHIAVDRCPAGAIDVVPGTSIQSAVGSAREGATFCLKSGVHRMQVIRPKSGQQFYGERHTILNGSRLLARFTRDGRYWLAPAQGPYGQSHGQCAKETPTCGLPEAMFIDDKPLSPALSKDHLETGQFYLDQTSDRLYLVDDPRGHTIEATAAAVAFDGEAPNVVISHITIEKYASPAEKGAIQARSATGWMIENCEVRLNSGGGIGVGTGTHVRSCDIHDNGQIGITGVGAGVMIDDNRIWRNNTRGFDFRWEAGGAKLATSNGVTFRGNHVFGNMGPGLWCDIGCQNVVYEDNLVERNQDSGIFHEISFNAIIRNNVLRHNGSGHRVWYWGADILIAASQDVKVYGNRLTVSPGGCGIMLIDQSRSKKGGGKYKTRNNTIHGNQMDFEGALCAGGVSDVQPADENYSIITEGNNRYDGNIYRVSRAAGPARFVWGHSTFDWDGLRDIGVELHGQLITY